MQLNIGNYSTSRNLNINKKDAYFGSGMFFSLWHLSTPHTAAVIQEELNEMHIIFFFLNYISCNLELNYLTLQMITDYTLLTFVDYFSKTESFDTIVVASIIVIFYKILW